MKTDTDWRQTAYWGHIDLVDVGPRNFVNNVPGSFSLRKEAARVMCSVLQTPDWTNDQEGLRGVTGGNQILNASRHVGSVLSIQLEQVRLPRPDLDTLGDPDTGLERLDLLYAGIFGRANRTSYWVRGVVDGLMNFNLKPEAVAQVDGEQLTVGVTAHQGREEGCVILRKLTPTAYYVRS